MMYVALTKEHRELGQLIRDSHDVHLRELQEIRKELAEIKTQLARIERDMP